MMIWLWFPYADSPGARTSPRTMSGGTRNDRGDGERVLRPGRVVVLPVVDRVELIRSEHSQVDGISHAEGELGRRTPRFTTIAVVSVSSGSAPSSTWNVRSNDDGSSASALTPVGVPSGARCTPATYASTSARSTPGIERTASADSDGANSTRSYGRLAAK